MKHIFIKACLLIGTIVGSHGKDVSINGMNCVIPESWSVSKPVQGYDSVHGKIQTDMDGFVIGWSLGPGAGDIVEQRSKDGAEVVIKEDFKHESGAVVGKMLIVKGSGGFWAYATIHICNFHAYCKDREQVDMFARFIRSSFQEPKAIGNDMPSVIGVWRSDAETTNTYLDKHAKLNDHQKKVFARFFGRAVVTFRTDGTGTILMEAVTIPKKDGGKLELESTKSDFTFKVLDAAKSQIVIKSDMGEGIFDGFPFAILKFHDQDTYSVSLSDGIAGINGREFFKRIKTTKSEGGADQPATVPESKSEGEDKRR